MPNVKLRSYFISFFLLAAAAVVAWFPVQKQSAGAKINLQHLVPENLSSWKGHTFDTASYADKYESINELLVREYSKENPFSLRSGMTSAGMIVEYSSDLRSNFSFHYPENCHRAKGNAIEFLDPLRIELEEGKTLQAKRLFIKGSPSSYEKDDKLVTYWIVMDGKRYDNALFVKLDQMFAGLFSRAKQGFLMRVDYYEDFEYTPEGIEKASRVTQDLLRDLYQSVPAVKRGLIFGADLA